MKQSGNETRYNARLSSQSRVIRYSLEGVLLHTMRQVGESRMFEAKLLSLYGSSNKVILEF